MGDQVRFENQGAVKLPKMQFCTEFLEQNRKHLVLQLQVTEGKPIGKNQFCGQFIERDTVEECFVVVNNAESFDSFLSHVNKGLDNPVHTCQQMYGIDKADE